MLLHENLGGRLDFFDKRLYNTIIFVLGGYP